MPRKKKKHILIIDDEQYWLKITAFILQRKGYIVHTAKSGAEALKSLSKFTPDLILSDIKMPDMNGFDLVNNLKQIPKTSSTPVIFFSAIDDYDAKKFAKKLGAVDYLIKPFNENDVTSIISKHIHL